MSADTPQFFSFADFKNSFFYGARNDLSFKFLKDLSDEEAAQFFQELLWKLGETYDDGDVSRLVQHGIEWQVRGYDKKGRWIYDEGPFTPLTKPLSESRLLLLTSSGHFVEGDDPEPFGVKDMTQEEAMMRIGDFLQSAPTLSTIPVNTPPDQLCVRHGGYDIRGAQADPNVVLPTQRLLEMEADGVIGELAPEAYSFVGAAAQTPLLRRTGPQWVSLFREQQIDAALLVPAWPVCHVSVGHVARLMEEAGIPTVIIGVRAFRTRLAGMALPRIVSTPHPMGRPLGTPGDREGQRATILAALELLANAKGNGAIVDLTQPYRYGRKGERT